MNYGQWLFNELMDVTKQCPENFFVNTHEYKGKRVAIFDYSLTVPNDFGYGEALEARGSCFEIDENGDYLSIVALPFEKFFNLHEYDYHGNDDLKAKFESRYGVKCTAETVGALSSLDDTIIMDKRDGSIITFFDWYDGLDCKSNSSLTSDYKAEALKILREKYPLLYERISSVCSLGYSVSAEYTSNNPYRQIVLPYDEERIVVTGTRSHEDGSYMSYDDMVTEFGSEFVVDKIDTVIDQSSYEQENIEGYVVWNQSSGLRFKVKTEWYMERHRVKENILTPSNVWALYINGEVDDVSGFIPESNRPIFEYFLEQCDDLYKHIIQMGLELYELNKHIERKEYFHNIKVTDRRYKMAGVIAANLYNGELMPSIVERLKGEMLKRKNISRMGIPLWRYDGFD